jgi:hypothetical protein
MRIAGRNINLRFWVKTSLKVLLVLLAPSYANVEVDARLPGLEGYGGNYNCILFTVWALHYSRDVFFTIRTPATILAALGICVPGIYFARKLARQPRTAPIIDMALASGFATAFITLYCVYGISFDYSLLTTGSLALSLLVILPIFLREAELVGLARVLTEPDGTGVTERARGRTSRISWKYTIVGAVLAVAVFLAPYVLMVQTYSFGATVRYQVWSFLSSTSYDTSILVPYWSAFSGIAGIDDLFLILFVHGPRILFAFGILRYWRGMTSRTKVVLVGAIGFLLPTTLFMLVQEVFVFETLVFSSPLPILFFAGLLAMFMISPVYVENLDILERSSEVDLREMKSEDLKHRVNVPILYALKSRAVLAFSRLRRAEADEKSESEEQAADT